MRYLTDTVSQDPKYDQLMLAKRLGMPPRAVVVRLADKIDNVRSIQKGELKHWWGKIKLKFNTKFYFSKSLINMQICFKNVFFRILNFVVTIA